MFAPHALKCLSSDKQHALKCLSSDKQHALKCQSSDKQHALKGQKLLAQGVWGKTCETSVKNNAESGQLKSLNHNK